MSKAKDNATLSSRLRSEVGALVTSDYDSLETILPGTDGQVLTADSTHPNGIKWADPDVGPTDYVNGPISAVSNNLSAFDGTTGKLLRDSGVATSAVVTKTGVETLTNKTHSTGSTWNGTAVGTAYGGTAQTTYAKGDIIYAPAVNVLGKLAVSTSGKALTVSSTGIPEWSDPILTPVQVTDLTDAGDSALHYHATDRALGNATGILAVANGGTASTTAQAAINTLSNVAAATEGHVLTKVGSNAAWAAASGAGIGDVTGPAVAVDSNVAAFNGTTGKLIKDGGIATSAIATLTGTQTLTGKTINLTSNTLVATSAQLAAALTDETGTGAAVFAGSPTLTGTPTAPTAAAGTNTTQLATTAHVINERGATATLTYKTMSTGSVWSGGIISPLYGGTAQSSWTKGDLLYASAANTLSKLPVGAVGQTLAVSSAGTPAWTSPATGTEVTTLTSAAIQTAINAAAAAGGGIVKLIAGTYIISSTLVIPSKVNLVGSGIDVTILYLANGVNASVITTTNTSTLISGSTSAEGAQYWGISDLSIDGNKTNNTAGHGIYTYSRAFKIERVKITYCKERGVYSKWGYSTAAWADSDALKYDPFMEASVDGLYVGYCDKEGVYWDGPHDSKLSNIYVALCSHTTANAYDGIYVGPGAGGTIWTNCHPWGDNHRYNWNISCGWTTFTGCISDDGYTAGVYVNADHVTWTGGFVFGAVFGTPDADDLAYRGIVLSSNAWHPYIDSQCVNCSQGAIDFTSAPNGSGTIILSGSVDTSLNVGTTTYGYKGTPPSNLNVQINIYDPDVNDSYYRPASLGTPTDDTSTWFATGVDGYWSTAGTYLNISSTSSSVNPPVWVQNTTSYNNTNTAHYASCALFETIKTSGAGVPNSLTGSVRITGGTGDAIGVHGQVVADTATTGISTGVWARATGPTAAITAGAICGLEINVDNRYGAIAAKARKDGGSYVGLLIYNFSGAGKANHFGFVVEGTATDAYHVGGLIEDFQGTGLNILGTRSANYGLHINSEVADQLGRGIYLGTRCATAGIGLGDNKFNWGSSSQIVSNNGDMLYNATSSTLYFNQGGTTTEVLCGSGVGTSGSYTADRKMAVKMGGVTYYVLMSTTA